MTTPKIPNKTKEHTLLFGKNFICVWTLPRDSKPIVRVEVEHSQINVGRLFHLACDTINLHKRSRSLFALFRGITYPTRKYDNDSFIFLPCKAAICIQKWTFDFTAETRIIKTDDVAFRLLALQFIFNVECKRIKPTSEQSKDLEIYLDPNFVCYKQYVEEARKIDGYHSHIIQNITVLKKTQIVNMTLQKDSKVDVVCSSRKFIIISDTMEVSIPWRKIRRFAEVEETKSINIEIFFSEDRAFAWIELQCSQGTILLQIIAEYIDQVKKRLEIPEFRQPKWVTEPKRNKLTWEIIKSELFGTKKEKKLPILQTFDEFVESSSEDEENEYVNITSNYKQKYAFQSPQDEHLQLATSSQSSDIPYLLAATSQHHSRENPSLVSPQHHIKSDNITNEQDNMFDIDGIEDVMGN